MPHPFLKGSYEHSCGGTLLGCGSGKGRVVWQAAHYPFARVIGVEISPLLNAVARRNIEANLARLKCRDVELVMADATAFQIPDDMTFAYFFSPFTGEIFLRTIQRIIESLDRNPRRVTLIYANPQMDEELRATGRFELVRTLRGVRRDVDEHGTMSIYTSLEREKTAP